MKLRYYLLDTNILGPLVELRAGGTNPECKALRRHWDTLPEEARVFLCPISVGEVEYGLRVAPFNKPEAEKLTRELLLTFHNSGFLLDIDVDLACNYYAELRARLFKSFAPKTKKQRNNLKKRIEEWKDPATSKELQIQENDLWIAAVAMSHNLILVTRDKMDAIRRVAGTDIEFENWCQLPP
jgi:predicted nucleic acid-binding protein